MRITANGIAIEIDDQGPPAGEPILLIMGLGMPLLGWPDELVADLVGRGYRVVRFDNRDIGLSESFDHLGVPSVIAASLRYLVHLPVRSPYPLSAMADDAIGVLDALGLASAHIVGASMGGMIAQHVAAKFPTRTRSLSLVMTSSGARHLPQASGKVRRLLLKGAPGKDVDSIVSHLTQVVTTIGSPGYPPEPERLRQRLLAMVTRSWRPAGTARQLLAIAADGDRSPWLNRIQAPTLVMHGLDDPLVPVAAGHDLVAKIGGTTSDFVPGMGHDFPPALMSRMAAGIAGNAARATKGADFNRALLVDS